jgi:hypothetical protein
MHFFHFTGNHYSPTLPAMHSSSFFWTGDRRTSFYHADAKISYINFPFLIKRDGIFLHFCQQYVHIPSKGGVIVIAVPEFRRRFVSLSSILTEFIYGFPPSLQGKERMLPLLGHICFLPNPSQFIRRLRWSGGSHAGL